MRRFEVWLDKGVPGKEPATVIVEMPDDATPKEIEEACDDALTDMIATEIDSGWRELT